MYKEYKELNNSKIYLLKKCIKLIKNIIYISILYIYMPEMFINNLNEDDNRDKMVFMACFIVFSGIMSYILQNYQCKPPGSETNLPYHIDVVSPVGGQPTGLKLIILRILLAIR